METLKKVVAYGGILVLVGTVLVLNAVAPDCPEERYWNDHMALMNQWADSHEAARYGPQDGESLANAVAGMEEARASAAAHNTPDCAAETHQAMLAYMDAVLHAYDAFLSGDEAEGARRLEAAAVLGDRRTELLQAFNPLID